MRIKDALVKVLLIGASGKLGTRVYNALNRESKYQIGLFSRRVQDLPFSAPYAAFPGDILLPETLSPAIQWADVVINCSGLVSYKKGDGPLLRKINVEGARNIARACARYQKPLVHSGSAIYYGSSSSPIYFKEDDLIENVYRGQYAYSKFLGDDAVMASGCSYIILRPGTLVSTLTNLYKFYNKGWVADLKGGASFASIDEVANAFVKAAELILKEQKSQVFNLGGNNLSFAEVFESFKRINPRPTRFLRNEIMGGLSLLNDYLLSPLFNKTILTRENYLTSNRFTYIDSGKAQAILHYKIPSLDIFSESLIV